jgi:hypothetical protein
MRRSADWVPLVFREFLMSVLRPLVRSAGTSLALALPLLLAAPVVQAQGLLDVGRALLGLPSEDNKPDINYRERAPLVVPPDAQRLRPPAERAEADQRANWPQDPDVIARRKAAEDAKKPIYVPTDRQMGRAATVEELRAQRRAGVTVNSHQDTPLNDRSSVNMLGGIEMLRNQREQLRTRENEPYAEPKREYLTDPPVGARAAAGNAPVRATRDSGPASDPQRPDMLAVTRDGPNRR